MKVDFRFAIFDLRFQLQIANLKSPIRNTEFMDAYG